MTRKMSGGGWRDSSRVTRLRLLTVASANETCRLPLRIPGSREWSPVDGRVGEGIVPD